MRTGRTIFSDWRFWIFAALCGGLAYWLVNAVFAPLNQDEGWYLLAAQNVALRGQVPYRDFLFTQGPVFPFVYAWLHPLWGGMGVLGGRFLSAAFGFLAAVLAADAARIAVSETHREKGGAVFFAVFSLTAFLPDFNSFTAITKTYALSALLLSLGFRLLATRDLAWYKGLTAGICFAAAAGTRISLCVVAASLWAVLLADDITARKTRRLRQCPSLWMAIGCLLFLLPVYGTILLTEAERFFFSQSYHTARSGSGLMGWLVLRAGFVSLSLQGAYPLFLAECLIPVLPGRLRWRALPPVVRGAGVAFAAMTLVHLLTPFPYNDYNTPVLPVGALFFGTCLCLRLPELRTRFALSALSAAACFCLASPLCMKWVGGEQHLFWFTTDTIPQVFRLREAGAWIRANNPEGAPLFAQDAYLAVEAGCPVEPGMEMGPFSLFPGLSDEQARRHHCHTPSTLVRALETTPATVAAVSGYTFAIACPSTDPVPGETRQALLSALERRFGKPVAEVPSFGQQRTTLRLYVRDREHPASAPAAE